MSQNAAEKEVIGLCIVWEALGEIVNHSLLQILRSNDSTGDAEVRFQTREHQQLFLVRLLDFVDEKGDKTLTGVKGSCLDVLRTVCRTRRFDVDGSSGPLGHAVEGFHGWLSANTPLTLWLPTLDIEARLRVPRRELLFIAGNQSKHNLARLSGVVNRTSKLLLEHGHSVSPELIPLALDEIRHQLHEDYFAYYGAWISEHLVLLQWAIHNYLQPTFQRVYRPPAGGDYRYSYEVPPDIDSEIGRHWFWRLMNHVRARPFVEPFFAPKYLKEEALRGGH